MTKPERKKWARVFDRALYLIAAAFIVYAVWPRGAQLDSGSDAPHFELPRIDEEGSFSFSGARERPLLVEAFASWCGACKRNKGMLNSFHGSNLEIDTLAVSVDSNPQAAKKAQMSWPVLGAVAHDAEGSLSRLYDIQVLPTYILISREGKILASQSGGLSPSQLQNWVKLAQKE